MTLELTQNEAKILRAMIDVVRQSPIGEECLFDQDSTNNMDDDTIGETFFSLKEKIQSL